MNSTNIVVLHCFDILLCGQFIIAPLCSVLVFCFHCKFYFIVFIYFFFSLSLFQFLYSFRLGFIFFCFFLQNLCQPYWLCQSVFLTSACVCVCACACVCPYIRVCCYVQKNTEVCACASMLTYMHVFLYICMCGMICMRAGVHLLTHMNSCMDVRESIQKQHPPLTSSKLMHNLACYCWCTRDGVYCASQYPISQPSSHFSQNNYAAQNWLASTVYTRKTYLLNYRCKCHMSNV